MNWLVIGIDLLFVLAGILVVLGIVRRSKNIKLILMALMIAIVVYAGYFIVGYIYHTTILIPVSQNVHGSISVSSTGVVLFIITTFFIASFFRDIK